jgi:hypothetical protein
VCGRVYERLHLYCVFFQKKVQFSTERAILSSYIISCHRSPNMPCHTKRENDIIVIVFFNCLVCQQNILHGI